MSTVDNIPLGKVNATKAEIKQVSRKTNAFIYIKVTTDKFIIFYKFQLYLFF